MYNIHVTTIQIKTQDMLNTPAWFLMPSPSQLHPNYNSGIYHFSFAYSLTLYVTHNMKMPVALQVNEPYVAITHTPVVGSSCVCTYGWLIMCIHICA